MSIQVRFLVLVLQPHWRQTILRKVSINFLLPFKLTHTQRAFSYAFKKGELSRSEEESRGN